MPRPGQFFPCFAVIELIRLSSVSLPQTMRLPRRAMMSGEAPALDRGFFCSRSNSAWIGPRSEPKTKYKIFEQEKVLFAISTYPPKNNQNKVDYETTNAISK